MIILKIKIGDYFFIFHLKRIKSYFHLLLRTELYVESLPCQFLLASMAILQYIYQDLVILPIKILFIRTKLVHHSIRSISIFWPPTFLLNQPNGELKHFMP